jgi:hypothetical protein
VSAPKKTVDKRITPEFMAQAGKGRPKGVPNKNTTLLKDMILQALSDAGGPDYLKKQANKNPTAFLTLVGKVLPMQLQGDAENPLTFVDATQDAERVAAMIASLAQRAVDGPTLQ